MSDTSPLRIALVGAGFWASNHIVPAITARPDLALTWIVRSSEAGARDTAAALGIPNWSADYRAVVARDDVDAVIVAVPNALHAEVGLAALASHKHVLIEKPFAVTLEQGEALCAAARASDRVAMVDENWVFAAVVRHALDAIARGEIGTPFMVRAAMDVNMGFMFAPGAWRNDLTRAAGGVMMDGGTHEITVCRRIMGEIGEVTAIHGNHTLPQAAPGDAGATMLVRFRSGMAGVLSTHVGLHVAKPETTFRVLGTEGTIDFDTHGSVVSLSRLGERHEKHFTAPSRGVPEIVDHFAHCIRTGEAPVTSFEDQLQSLRVVLASYASAREGKTVRLAAQV